MQDIHEQRQERTAWFRHDRFGLFIHWGIYALPARGEWVQSRERIRDEEYRGYSGRFAPDRYNPRAWAQMAHSTGMRYAVMTAKHHDGFCLFDSALTDYKSTNSPARRDLIREYTKAMRDSGLKVGLYYSLLDWHHPDYPHYKDAHHPMRNNDAFARHAYDFDRYVAYLHGQVRELLTNYGKIDILWFDFSYDDMTGEKWRATELVRMARELQPHLIIDNRLGGNMSSRKPEPYAGDFVTPEQMIPPAPPLDEEGRLLPWEACVTQNGNWGYHRDDDSYMSARQVIRCLVNCVSKGGNLLINTGPNARGEVPEMQRRILTQVGQWMELHEDSVVGAGPANFPKPEWGRFTQNGNRLFCHIQDPGMGTIVLPGMSKMLRNPRLLASGHDVSSAYWITTNHPDDAFIILPRRESEFDPVVEWELVD